MNYSKIQLTVSENSSIFWNSCKCSQIMMSLHVQTIVSEHPIIWMPDIPIPCTNKIQELQVANDNTNGHLVDFP